MKKILLIILLVICSILSYSQAIPNDQNIRRLRLKATDALSTDLWFIWRGDTIDFTDLVVIPNEVEAKLSLKSGEILIIDKDTIKWTGTPKNGETLIRKDSIWTNVLYNDSTIIRELAAEVIRDSFDIIEVNDTLWLATKDWVESLTADSAEIVRIIGNTPKFLETEDSTIYATQYDIKDFIGGANAVYNTIPVSNTSISVIYPFEVQNADYWYQVEAWYNTTVDGKDIRVNNGIYDFVPTTTGFTCKVNYATGYLKYFIADTVDLLCVGGGLQELDPIWTQDSSDVLTLTRNITGLLGAEQDTLNAVTRTTAFTTDNAITMVDGSGRKIQQSAANVDDNGSINIPTGQNYKINNVTLLLNHLKSGSIGAAGTIPVSAGSASTPTWSSVYSAIATTPTQNKLVKFGVSKLENSIISESGTVATVGGTLVANSATTNSEVINLGQLKDKVKSGSISMVTGTWPIYFEKSFPTAGYVTSVWGIDSNGNEIGINVNTQYDYGFEIDVPEDCIVKYDCTYPETITTPENNQWYGIEYDVTNPSPTLTRIGNLSLHAKLPVQNKMKGCLLTDAITVNYYLSPTDWTKKIDGITASVLNGTDGQVMIEKPVIYWKFETEGNINRVKISEYPLAGFSQKPKCYIGAYEASLQRSNSKLASVVNTTTDFRGGNNTSAWDAASNSLLGKPATNYNIVNARTYARNRGTGWNQLIYDNYMELFWLFAIEYATFNSQLAVNSTLTSSGYKQGGLGNGVTTANATEWTNFNGSNPFINCGASNSLGSGSGEVSVNVADFGGTGVTRTFTVNRYRGVENPFGHIWKFVDGLNVYNSSGVTTMYVIDNPSNLASDTQTNSRTGGIISAVDGYGKTMLFGSSGDIVPSVATGASSTTYMCDYFYPNLTANSWRIPLFGGYANGSSGAGFLSSSFSYSSSSAFTFLGSRLSAR